MEVKNSINSFGCGEAKELICMTHGHELRDEGNVGEGGGAAGWRGIKGRKSGGKNGRKNCNSIINKIY